jgi:hypothetical protein
VPLILRPVSSTLSLSQDPAARITVLVNPAEPNALPIMVLQDPVVTFEPALSPKNKLLDPVVLLQPALYPMKLLQDPVVLRVPA